MDLSQFVLTVTRADEEPAATVDLSQFIITVTPATSDEAES
ncbi:hypothetical protein [Jiangella gansuensis]|nr:hypothetical protein [Jiangella gansuensis]